jgi:hypothetical protein
LTLAHSNGTRIGKPCRSPRVIDPLPLPPLSPLWFDGKAIVEWLEEIPWASEHLTFPHIPIPLYPADSPAKVEVKMWQYWELSLAEEFWPLSRQQVTSSSLDGRARDAPKSPPSLSLSPPAFPRSSPTHINTSRSSFLFLFHQSTY